MKKNVLALSIATMIGGLGFSGAAMAQAAFDVNESGTGAIQIVPYFTVQDGNATALHVVNTDTTNAKAVKIRFRGASNSDDLLDFQVFLSPYDVWTGVVTADANGRLQLATADNSCTLPAEVRTQGATAQPDRLTMRLWDNVDKVNAQTREGYVEILEMATIRPTGGSAAETALFKAVKHVNGKAPCTPAAFDFLDSIIDGGAAAGLTGATNSLTASWYVLNVAASTTFSGSATALTIQGVDAATPANPVYAPQMAEQKSNLVSADPLFKNGLLVKQDFDVPDLSTPLTGASNQAAADTQAAALTDAINRTSVSNQFYQDAGLNAATDWVFSMPTRRYIVAANYDVAPTAAAYISWNADAQTALTASKFKTNSNVSVDTATGQLCVKADSQTIYDREEGSVKNGHVVSPGIAKPLQLCGEVSVATFGAKSPVGAAVAQSFVSTDYGSGWAAVNFGAGVPALGAAFTAAANSNAAAGMVGNYGITWPHFYK